jgi:hypothetical protein
MQVRIGHTKDVAEGQMRLFDLSGPRSPWQMRVDNCTPSMTVHPQRMLARGGHPGWNAGDLPLPW